MKLKHVVSSFLVVLVLWSCKEKVMPEETVLVTDNEFEYVVDQFADLRVLRYQVPGFEELALKEKKLVYYLTQAGLAGRDIIWDQNTSIILKSGKHWKTFTSHLRVINLLLTGAHLKCI